MYIHYIILGSSYKTGRRIALDIVYKDKKGEKIVKDTVKFLNKKCIFNSISTHVLPSKSDSFEAIKEYDKFFSNVVLINNKEEFAKLINKDRYLDGYDVSKYILTKVPCTHLKLEKLVYFSYADYLLNNNKKLFNDKILAYQKGPIIKSIYKKYDNNLEDDEKVYSKEQDYLPIRSRLLASEDGPKKVMSIDKTLEKYGDLSGSELVLLTHHENTPWSKVKERGLYKLINDNIIKKYHHNEVMEI